VIGAAHADTMNRTYLADMSDFGNKLGFYVDFENSAPDGQTCRLSTLKAYLGVADGKSWRFVQAGSDFRLNQAIHILATITPDGSTFMIGPQRVKSPGAYALAKSNTMKAGEVPAWASGPAEYRIVEKELTVRVGAAQYEFKFPSAGFSPALLLFENSLRVTRTVAISPTDTIFIDAAITIEPLVDASPFKPLLDRFAQVAQAQYPGKITSEAQLKAAFKADDAQLAAWKPRNDVDAYGGQLHVGWAGKESGFYTTSKHNGYWWLLSPLGNPLFYTGVCTATSPEWDSTPITGRGDLFAELPPKTGLTPSLWSQNVWGSDQKEYAAVHALNLIRRFGQTNFHNGALAECKKRLTAWGFSGLGKWSPALDGVPCVTDISLPSVPKIDRHFDVFDPEIRVKIKSALEKELAPSRNNPFVVGNSFGNEYDEIVIPSEIEHILAATTPSPAKLAFIEQALNHIYAGDESRLRGSWTVSNAGRLANQPLKAPAADVEALRRFYASRYYETLYHDFKEVDPNHLYLGFWIVPDWWVSDEDWNLIAPNVDVIGFDRYSDWPGIENLLARYDKPVLLGEFSFPSWYGGARGFGRYSVYTDSDAESGARYAALIAAASKCPQCIGAMWFQYRDEPITGRGPAPDNAVVAGEHYAFGLINACDLPKTDLVTRAREANLKANAVRLAAGG